MIHQDRLRGSVAVEFDSLATNFQAVVDRHGGGGALCVYWRGREVLNVAAGESRGGSAWTLDTVCPIWSITKALSALVVQQLMAEGELDRDRPVGELWPEFNARGKQGITLGHVLTHSAGVPCWPGYQRTVTIGSTAGWDRGQEIAEGIALAPPQWLPGSAFGYHAVTFGTLLDEPVRRRTGLRIGELLRERVAEPLGADVSIGLPSAWGQRAAALADARLVDPADREVVEAGWDPSTLSGQSLLNGSRTDGYRMAATANSASFQKANLPAANGFASAQGLARVFAALADGGRLDGADLGVGKTLARDSSVHVEGYDLVLRSHCRWALGYAKNSASTFLSPNDAAFGHRGNGGQIAFADPTAGLAMAFLSNQPLIWTGADLRQQQLIVSLYECVARATLA